MLGRQTACTLFGNAELSDNYQNLMWSICRASSDCLVVHHILERELVTCAQESVTISPI